MIIEFETTELVDDDLQITNQSQKKVLDGIQENSHA